MKRRVRRRFSRRLLDARIAGRRRARMFRRCWLLQEGPGRGRLRNAASAAALERLLVSPDFSVPDRSRSCECEAGCSLSAVRCRAGVALVVLPVEQHPGRRTARSGDSGQASRCQSARSAGAAHARRSARAHRAGGELLQPVAAGSQRLAAHAGRQQKISRGSTTTCGPRS